MASSICILDALKHFRLSAVNEGGKMLNSSLLMPENTAARRAVSLNGLWGFRLDPEGKGESEAWQRKIPKADTIPVPASFNDFYTDKESRDYCGDFWYETDFHLPREWQGRKVTVRFGSAGQTSVVYLNGREITRHEGAFLPFEADITDCALYGADNHLALRLNNELCESRMPVGSTITLPDGRKFAKPGFDFFNYAGIQRNVYLTARPLEHIYDYETVSSIEGEDAEIQYRVKTMGDSEVSVSLFDPEGILVAESRGKEGVLRVRNARLWEVGNAFLYQIVIRILDKQCQLLDEYKDWIGIRTIEVKEGKILLNGSPVYLRGFGRHEDADIIGRGLSLAVQKRDFELMKWIGANCFRTSHYPYAEEIYRLADAYGILVIDEAPAVGCFPNLMGTSVKDNDETPFFGRAAAEDLKAHHLQVLEEMITRDKNHPSVFCWSLLNEPYSIHKESVPYFREVFEFARKLDPQKRPETFAMLANSLPESSTCDDFCDIICLNRYYGWYLLGGSEIIIAEKMLKEELKGWEKKAPGKPLVFTEYGADTASQVDKLPSVMWSESYQEEFLQMYHDAFDESPNVVGELIWNLCDFQTGEGITRMDGNKKGIFTRQRQPKRAAFTLRERWKSLPLDYKGGKAHDAGAGRTE